MTSLIITWSFSEEFEWAQHSIIKCFEFLKNYLIYYYIMITITIMILIIIMIMIIIIIICHRQ